VEHISKTADKNQHVTKFLFGDMRRTLIAKIKIYDP